MKTNLFIPTYNAGKLWPSVLESIASQTARFNHKVIIDSGSTDDTLAMDLVRGFEIIKIDKSKFDHGGTRQLAIKTFDDADVFVFLTQDAILADPDSIAKMILKLEENPLLGMVYGRQLPHIGAKELESHARVFNYPAHSQVRSLQDAGKYGIKTISCSNSFAAYKKLAFVDVGGFPKGLILGEDVIIAGKMLLNGWQMAYHAESAVYHSHNYSIKEEFNRYFDIGVFHSDNSWIFEKFGRAESEGLKYLKSELSYLFKNNLWVLPKSGLSIMAKWLGYKAGLLHDHFPNKINRFLSMNPNFWDKHP